MPSAPSALDSARVAISSALLSAWESDASVESLRNRFVTGDWQAGEKRAQAQPGVDSDEEVREGRWGGGSAGVAGESG